MEDGKIFSSCVQCVCLTYHPLSHLVMPYSHLPGQQLVLLDFFQYQKIFIFYFFACVFLFITAYFGHLITAKHLCRSKFPWSKQLLRVKNKRGAEKNT